MLRTTLIATVLILSFAVAGLAADISGRWETKMSGPDGGEGMKITFVFKVDGDKLTGSVETDQGSMPITDGKINGDDLTFKVDVMGNAMTHTGKVSGDTIKVKVEGDMPMEFTLTRAAAK